uniref:Transmembrane protein 205 n=1 Tax=Serinus canaria TaxID=9135 RepID=A0A8C9MTP8_SERCA
MASDTEPSNAIKLLHLLFLSTSWGMQIWVTFVAGFVMSRHLPRHTFGSIQRELFPYYFHISSTCAFLNLTLFAMSHPSERLGSEHKAQIIIFLVCIAASVLNTQCFGRVASDLVAELQRLESSHGLGAGAGAGSPRAPQAAPCLRPQLRAAGAALRPPPRSVLALQPPVHRVQRAEPAPPGWPALCPLRVLPAGGWAVPTPCCPAVKQLPALGIKLQHPRVERLSLC